MNEWLLTFALFTALATAAPAQDWTYPGTVVRVIDGDSLMVSVRDWPAPFSPIEVRLDGIDTPESRRQDAKCSKEQRLGLIAKAWVKQEIPTGSEIAVIWTGSREKYGRLLARVSYAKGDLASELIRLGHARRYNGGKKSNWCK